MNTAGVQEHGTPRRSGTNPDGDGVYETRFFTVLKLIRSQEWEAFHFDPFSQNLLAA
ncbi:MAG: hypothetical protein ACRCUY_09625 [Thermoguttaceae bacterium]